MKNSICQIKKNTVESLNKRPGEAEQRIYKLEDKFLGNIPDRQNKNEKQLEKLKIVLNTG